MNDRVSVAFFLRKDRHRQIQTCLEQLRKERADLQAALEAKDAEVQEEEASLVGTAQVVSSKKQCGDRLWIGYSPATMLYHL
jgi:hypothetical protein